MAELRESNRYCGMLWMATPDEDLRRPFKWSRWGRPTVDGGMDGSRSKSFAVDTGSDLFSYRYRDCIASVCFVLYPDDYDKWIEFLRPLGYAF